MWAGIMGRTILEKTCATASLLLDKLVRYLDPLFALPIQTSRLVYFNDLVHQFGWYQELFQKNIPGWNWTAFLPAKGTGLRGDKVSAWREMNNDRSYEKTCRENAGKKENKKVLSLCYWCYELNWNDGLRDVRAEDELTDFAVDFHQNSQEPDRRVSLGLRISRIFTSGYGSLCFW